MSIKKSWRNRLTTVAVLISIAATAHSMYVIVMFLDGLGGGNLHLTDGIVCVIYLLGALPVTLAFATTFLISKNRTLHLSGWMFTFLAVAITAVLYGFILVLTVRLSNVLYRYL